MSSEPGKGTHVDISLNVPRLEPDAGQADDEVEGLASPGSMSILVVDDYPANRVLLAQQLSYLGHRVIDAENGAHGLVAWRAGRFNVVITDCNMPCFGPDSQCTARRN